jgi:tricorn protease
MRYIRPLVLLLSAWSLCVGALDAAPLIFREPTLSRDAIVFVYAGDLWRVSRQGGDAVRLTTDPGQERTPAFSPDGTQIAFTAEYDGNLDVYIMPAGGGIPVRLTSHPSADVVTGWTPDGKSVLFASSRAVPTDGARLYTVPAAGGPATELPLPIAVDGSFSPDGRRLAYVPTLQWQRAWKRYRGGQTRRIWLADLADSSVESVPHGEASEFNPMWIGDTIYFLSDRNGPVSLFAYDLKTKKTRACFENSGLDIKSASAGPGAIVFSQFDALRLYDLASGKVTTVDVRLTGDLEQVRTRFKKVESKSLVHGHPSPTGKRAVFETHGEIVTVPAEKGDPRDLTQTPGIAERDPAWSPDGKWIAYFSDESGDYALHLRDPSGLGEVRKIKLGDAPSFFYHPTWSPDSKQIAYTDKRDNLWLLNVAKGTSKLVDKQPLPTGFEPDPCAFSWSPDSRWLTYSKILMNRLTAIYVYNLESGETHQVTDGMSDAAFPQFSDSGQYLYFAASTDSGPAGGWGDLSAANRPVTRSIYLAVLDKTNASPLAPESDEEKSDAEKSKDSPKEAEKTSEKSGATNSAGTNVTAKAEDAKAAETNAVPPVKIDFENIGQRILALPMPAKNYKGLYAGKSNSFFALEGPTVDPLGEEGPEECVVQKFDLTKRKAEKFADGVKFFEVANNREKVLFQKGDDWFLTSADAPAKDGDGQLKLDGFQIAIDPRAEWRQMYHETWRIERDFFYDPGHHGLDLDATETRYKPYLDGLASRADLNFLFEEMLGEMTVGHMFIGGGDVPEVKHIRVGLLGADYSIANGRYRFSKIYDGENWNPGLRAPLTEPGVNVAVGDYLLAVDGRDIPGTAELYSFFQDKADKLVTLRVGPNSDGSGARDVKVKPVGDEHGLRNRAWVEDNRRTVDRLSSNRLAYIHLPDTYGGGYTAFNRYFFAQIDKQGFVIDERFNHGGLLADYFVDYLHRKVLSNVANRDGADYSLPLGASSGPKVMIINEFAGSGGDALPWYFRKLEIGPLVGRRTWGGLVGIGGYPELIDGGTVTAPSEAIYGTTGQYEVENKGVAPDFEVELDPKAWREGRDTQLEKAVQLALESLAKNPPAPFKRPAYPNYHPKP